MLRRSHASENWPLYKDIVKSTISVVFMGTPHRGSTQKAKMGISARRVATNMLRFDANSSILSALIEDSPELELTRCEFTRLWRLYGFQVKTFQEAFGFSKVNVAGMNHKVSCHAKYVM